jgi:hypothetical protein
MHELAKKYGGFCLSTEYMGVATALKWKCANDHVWEATPAKVLKGRWCHYCKQSFCEAIVRCHLEQLTGLPFPKARPKWLKNRYGFGLELDGFCANVNCAFEHNGLQHYVETPYSNSKERVKRIKENDLDKMSICEHHGISVLVVPQLFKLTSLESLKQMIRNFCFENSLPFRDVEVDYSSAYFPSNEEMKQKLSHIAELKGGRLLSEKYICSDLKLKFECDTGHVWWALPHNVTSGHWCPKCARDRRMIV